MSNIVLIGFMACGKSRVGELLAKRLGFNFIDIDQTIERDEGRSIPTIFAEHGEAYFRALEKKAINDLHGIARSVIVTGGGAPMSFDNARHLKKLGEIFFLDASLSLILKRLHTSKKRPLGDITGDNNCGKIKELFIYRRPVYLNLGHVVDVNHENRDQTCDTIIERFLALERLQQVAKTTVSHVISSYPIYHQSKILHSITDIVESLGLDDHRPLIITSDRVRQVLKGPVESLKRNLGENTEIIALKDGEEHKTMSSVAGLHEQMFKLGLTRKTLVVALGGGNVGDIAGFASSIYLRGVPFIQVPSTLLAMVDASIGGKTGVDVEFGKNLLGAFHNPQAVVIDPDLLSTLPAEDFSCGMAEIIKHAIIADRELFYELKDHELDRVAMIKRALKVKADIVFNDPHEHNVRAHLNLGHTFAHAIEKVSHYQIKHGIAVGIGLVLATKLAHRVKVLEENFLADLEHILKKFNLPTSLPANLSPADLVLAMKYDKKRDPQGLKFILPKKIGEVVVHYVDDKDIFIDSDSHG